MSIVAPGRYSTGKRCCAESREILRRVAHPLEKLCNDCTGIATRGIEQHIGELRQQVADMLFARAGKGLERSTERKAQVGAGIAVRDREYIDTVQKILLANDAVNAGTQGVCKVVSVQLEVTGQWIRSRQSFARQQEIRALVTKHNTLRSDLLDDRSFA